MVSAADQATSGKAVAFDRCGGHPALDFVNSLDNRFGGKSRIEGLENYSDLLRFAREVGLLDSGHAVQVARAVTPEAAVRALRAGRALREALAETLYAVVDERPPPAASLEMLEHYFHVADRHRELRWQPDIGGDAALAWSWRINEAKAELPVWAIAHAARDLMLSPDMQRLRACEVETCRWLFLDTSRNHTRRWCKMKVCGNRMKARRYQVRHSG
ncbi:MAG: CGNR zinc finger domain-containing protein [Steroidobacteraceae bacterium]